MDGENGKMGNRSWKEIGIEMKGEKEWIEKRERKSGRAMRR